MPMHLALQSTKSKKLTVHAFLQKGYLLSRPIFLLFFLLLKRRKHIILEPSRWSRPMASCPPNDVNHGLRENSISGLQREQQWAEWGEK